MKEFYKKALPSTGVYCVATIDPIAKLTKHKFVENIDDLAEFVESKRIHQPISLLHLVHLVGIAVKLMRPSLLGRSLLILMLAKEKVIHLNKMLSMRLTNSY